MSNTERFSNMKIEVNQDQPLGEIVSELQRLGFSYDGEMSSSRESTSALGTWQDGTYCTYLTIHSLDGHDLTTLTELKLMESK